MEEVIRIQFHFLLKIWEIKMDFKWIIGIGNNFKWSMGF